MIKSGLLVDVLEDRNHLAMTYRTHHVEIVFHFRAVHITKVRVGAVTPRAGRNPVRISIVTRADVV